MKYYLESAGDVISEVRSSESGLTADEAAKRLSENGPNALAKAKKDSIIKQFFSQLTDPMIIILIVAAVISGITSFYSGEGYADVIIILVVVVLNGILGVYQKSKAEKAIDALQEMAASESRVLRDGQVVRIHSSDVVVGDVVLFEAGDAVPADGRLIDCASLKIEESALTGESVPVDKTTDPISAGAGDVPLGDRKNMVYMGSSAAYGRGAAVITATGMDTEMGKIADAISKAEEGQTPLQLKLKQLSKVLTVLVLCICAVIFAVGLLRAGSFSRDVLLDTFMIAVSLAVAAIPEGLVAVVTVVLSIGVTNMSRRKAIIRKLTAVETLGCAQIICSDKTGTLTQNKMTVVEYRGTDEQLLAKALALCSDAEYDAEAEVSVGEPTECALTDYAARLGMPKGDLKEAEPRIGEAPFDSLRKMMSTVHETADGVIQYTKGSPDDLLRCCTHYLKDGAPVPLDDGVREQILGENKEMADRALRVLMCAVRRWDGRPDDFSPDSLEQGLCYIGLVGMIDPVRPEVKAAIEECKSSGIRPIMITGDHIATAAAIAKDLGILREGDEAITGAQLSEMSDEEYAKRFRNISVYARVQPEHKTRIVNAWRGAGYVAAMTGDGVNDAPSIKAADIGVGMGITGTDVTKNVADMVLADDNFATIVSAVEEGRRIYDNIRKAIQFLLGSNMSEVLAIFAATMLGFTILGPVHLLWINLITDTFPALALGMEKAERNIMNRRPRDPKDGIFAGGMGFDILYQGCLVALLTMAAFLIGHYMETGVFEITNSLVGTTMAFITMSMSEVFHSFNMRSQRGSAFTIGNVNKMLILAGAVSFVCTAAVVLVPFLAKAFGFAQLSLPQYAVAIALAVCIIPIVEIVKFFQRKAAVNADA